MQRNIKMRHVLGWSVKKYDSVLKYVVPISKTVLHLVSKTVLLVTSSRSKNVPLKLLKTAKSLISSCWRIGETIFSKYWWNPQISAAVHYFQKQLLEVFCDFIKKKLHFEEHLRTLLLYFHYNYLHHFHYRYFH